VALAVAAAAVSAWTALAVSRGDALGNVDGSPDLVAPFVAVALALAVVALGSLGVARIASPAAVGGVPLMALVAVSVPWTVFALRYAGRGSVVTRGRVAGGCLVAVSMLSVFLLDLTGSVSEDWMAAANFLGSILVLSILAILLTACGIVVVSTYRHGGTSAAHGAAVVFPVVALTMGGQVNAILNLLSTATVTGLTLLVTAVALPVAAWRYDALAVRPGTGALGERAVVDTMNEAFVVVDRRL